MKILMSIAALTVLVCGSAFAGIGAPAGPDPFAMSIDESTNSWSINGNPLAMSLVNGVETGVLPEQVVAGDVLLKDADGSLSDVLRFPDQGNGCSTIVQFISTDTCPGEVFDTNNFGDIQRSHVSIDENPDGFTSWLPGGNTYCINSPEEGLPGAPCQVTPEPSSLALVGMGGLPLLGLLKRRFIG